jgi:hypothetical protein
MNYSNITKLNRSESKEYNTDRANRMAVYSRPVVDMIECVERAINSNNVVEVSIGYTNNGMIGMHVCETLVKKSVASKRVCKVAYKDGYFVDWYTMFVAEKECNMVNVVTFEERLDGIVYHSATYMVRNGYFDYVDTFSWYEYFETATIIDNETNVVAYDIDEQGEATFANRIKTNKELTLNVEMLYSNVEFEEFDKSIASDWNAFSLAPVVICISGKVETLSTHFEVYHTLKPFMNKNGKLNIEAFVNHVDFVVFGDEEEFWIKERKSIDYMVQYFGREDLVFGASIEDVRNYIAPVQYVAETVDANETENETINNSLQENSTEKLANIKINNVSLQKETETTLITSETNTNTNIQNSNKMETMNVNNANETKKQSAKQAIKELAKSANESNVNNIRAYFGEITDEQAQLIHGTISHFDVDAPSVGVLVYSYMFIEYISCSKSELKKHVQFAASNVDAKKAVFEALKSLGGAVLPEQVAEKERAYYAAKDERRALQNFVAEYSTYKKALKIVREIIDGDFTLNKDAKQASETKTINAAIKSVKAFWKEEKYSLSGAIRRTVKVFNEFVNVDETSEDVERIEAVKLFASKGLVDYKTFSDFVTYDLVLNAFGYKVAENGDKICFRNGKLKEKFSETDIITAVAITLKGKQVGEIKE